MWMATEKVEVLFSVAHRVIIIDISFRTEIQYCPPFRIVEHRIR
jgi:hypothetical protein